MPSRGSADDDGGGQQDGVAVRDEHRAVGQSGDAPGLERQRTPGDFDF